MVGLGGSRELLDAALERADGGDSLDRGRLRGRAWRACPRTRSPACTSTCRACSAATPTPRRPQDRVGRRAAHARPDRLRARRTGRRRVQPAHRRRRLSEEDLPVASGDEAARSCSARARSGSACAIPASSWRSSSRPPGGGPRRASASTSSAQARALGAARPGRRQGPDRAADAATCRCRRRSTGAVRRRAPRSKDPAAFERDAGEGRRRAARVARPRGQRDATRATSTRSHGRTAARSCSES